MPFIWVFIRCCCCCSVSHSCPTPWTAACQAYLSITKFQILLKLISIESLMPSNYLKPYHPLLFLPSIFPRTGVISKELALHIRWPKHHHQYFQWIFRVDFFENWLIWSPCSPKYSQDSSPKPQFKSICSLVLSLFYCLHLTSILLEKP